MTEPSINRIAAELEIRNLLARLAQLADEGDLDQYLSLLTEDVVWTVPSNPIVGLSASERNGRDEIAAGVRERINAGMQGPGSATMHTVTTTSIQFENPTLATARSSFIYWSGGTTATISTIGRYHDTIRNIQNTWQLACRVITFE